MNAVWCIVSALNGAKPAGLPFWSVTPPLPQSPSGNTRCGSGATGKEQHGDSPNDAPNGTVESSLVADSSRAEAPSSMGGANLGLRSYDRKAGLGSGSSIALRRFLHSRK